MAKTRRAARTSTAGIGTPPPRPCGRPPNRGRRATVAERNAEGRRYPSDVHTASPSSNEGREVPSRGIHNVPENVGSDNHEEGAAQVPPTGTQGPPPGQHLPCQMVV